MKRPRPLNADNQIPTAEVIRQLIVLAFVNGETPHRGRHHCRSNTVQPGLELLQSYQVIHGHDHAITPIFLGKIDFLRGSKSPIRGAFYPL